MTRTVRKTAHAARSAQVQHAASFAEDAEKAAPVADLRALIRDIPDAAARLENASAAVAAANFLRRLREHSEKSPEQIAKSMNVNRARIYEIERGDGVNGPTWSVMCRWARACGYELRLDVERLVDIEMRPDIEANAENRVDAENLTSDLS